MFHRRLGFTLLLSASLGLAGHAALVRAQCQDWHPGPGAAVTSGEYRAAALFDPDGAGPLPESLYVGGDFAGALGSTTELTNDLAAWDGTRWRGAGPFQLNGRINALAVVDLDGDGPNPPRLIVGGQFQTGSPPNWIRNIFAWDGAAVSALGEGFNNEVLALHVFDPDGSGPLPPRLYAAGRFTGSGSTPLTTGVARWNGAAWESPGTGISGTVNALTTFDPDADGPLAPTLVAAGMFTRNGATSSLAALGGTQWNAVGAGFNNEVTSVSTFDFDGEGPQPPRLVAAGRFTAIGSVTTFRGNAFFSGTAWQPIAPLSANGGSSGRTIGSFDPDGPGGVPAELVLSGAVMLPGEFVLRRLVALRNGAWVSVAPTATSGEVFALTQLVLPGESAPTLLVAGSLIATQPPDSFRLACYDGVALRPFQDGFGGLVRMLTVSHIGGEESIIAVGDFTRIPGGLARGVAAYRRGSWTPLGPVGPDSALIQSAFSYDPDGDGPRSEVLVVGGVFDAIGGVPALNVAQWDGLQWSAMGAGLSYFPTQFITYDRDGDGPAAPVLIAAGDAPSGGPGDPAFLRQWDGAAWAQFGPEFVSVNGPAMVTRITSMDPDGIGPLPRVLIVAGFFSRVGGVPVNNVASFTGARWLSLGTGFDTNPQSLFTWDSSGDGREVAVIGGAFTAAGGVPARGVAVWNGSAWSPLGDGFGLSPSGYQSYPSGFASFDLDGDGPLPSRLHATGFFTEASGLPAAGVARWNGTSWEALSSGLDSAAGSSLAEHRGAGESFPTLFVGGRFQSAGGLRSAFVARYSVQACCAADFNADGFVTTQDLFDFLVAFFALDPEADINHDSFINSTDFFELLTGLFAGC